MINKKLLFKAGNAGIVLNAMLLLTLTGCVGYVDGPRAGVYVAPPVVEVGVQDDYVYYPSYGIYFNSYRNQYAYMDGGAWVSRPEPMGVSVDVLLASPSVRMDFHDSPANHYAEVSRQYPRSWTPSGAPQAGREQAPRDSVQRDQAPKAQVQKAQAQKASRKPAKQSDEHEGR